MKCQTATEKWKAEQSEERQDITQQRAGSPALTAVVSWKVLLVVLKLKWSPNRSQYAQFYLEFLRTLDDIILIPCIKAAEWSLPKVPNYAITRR